VIWCCARSGGAAEDASERSGVIYEIIGVDETKLRMGELRLQTVRLGI